MQGTHVRSLVLEESACWGAAKLVHHNCWACALEPAYPGPELCNERPPQREALSATREWPPIVTTRESLCAATKTQHSEKKENGLIRICSHAPKKWQVSALLAHARPSVSVLFHLITLKRSKPLRPLYNFLHLYITYSRPHLCMKEFT